MLLRILRLSDRFYYSLAIGDTTIDGEKALRTNASAARRGDSEHLSATA